MAEQNLDVKVTESGTAVVSSEISKLAGQLDKVTAAQDRETAAATRAAAASEKTADGVAKFLAAQESKFAVVDRVAGLLGKFNLALELVTKAYEAGKSAVETYILKVKDLAPALEAVNKQLAERIRLNQQLVGAADDVAQAAGLDAAQLTQAERIESTRLRLQQQELQQRSADLQAQEQEARGRAGRQLDAAGGGGSIVLSEGELGRVGAELEKVGNQLAEVKLKRDALIAGARGREFGTGVAPTVGGGGAPEAEDILADLPDLQSEWVKRLGIKSDGDPLAGDGAGPFDVVARGVNAATEAMRAGLDVVGEYAAGLAEIQAGYDAAADQGADFAAATGKAALASAVAAAFMGESIAAALQSALEAKAIEASVEALWTLGKALYYSAVDPPLAGPLFAAAGYFAATAAAAGVGSALAGAAAGGGGGGARGGAPAERDIGPRRQTGADEGGPTTINVQIDGLSLSTAGQVGEAFLGAMERLRNTPGQRARLERVITGGNR